MSVWRDPWGVPHLRADSVEELAHLQGRVTAQDRPRQLESERLRGEGRYATLVGGDGEQWDAFAASVDIAGVARRAYDGLDAESAAFVAAYAEGVRSVLPDWQPWTPLAVFWVQQVLFSTYPTKLWQRHVRDTVGAQVQAMLRMEGLPQGSNAFALTGERTASGLPIVAGDPHRVLEAPGVYQQVGLACPEFDVVGLTFPGVPGVQHVGHTGEVAWAVTNAMADYQDVGADDALLSPASVLGDLGFAAILPLLRARTVADVVAALEAWVEPVNNVVIADRAGDVVHQVAGRMPARDADGTWTGWVELPRVEPRDGAVVSANDRATGDFAVLGDGFATPYRRDRIRELLGTLDRAEVCDAAAVLTDDLALAADPLLALVAAAPGLPAAAAAVRDRLLVWDRRMAAESADAALFAAVREQVVERICAAEVLAPLHAPCPYGDLFAPWFDLRVRVAAALPGLLGREEAFGLDPAAVVRDALVAVAERPPGGTWGERHRLAPVPAAGVTASWAGTPVSGDSDCVAATGWVPGSDHCWRGPVVRYVLDLADRGRSRWAVPGGAAEEGRHAADQLAAWESGALLPVAPFTLEPVDPARDADLIHRWVTAPRAEFWGMTERTRDEVEEIYAYIAEQPHLSASLVRSDGIPVGIFQTYDPCVDEIGEFYDRRPGDLGVHLFLSDDPARLRQTPALVAFLMARAFADPDVRRVVLEPDVANAKSVALMRRLGATIGPVVQMPGKQAQFAFLTR